MDCKSYAVSVVQSLNSVLLWHSQHRRLFNTRVIGLQQRVMAASAAGGGKTKDKSALLAALEQRVVAHGSRAAGKIERAEQLGEKLSDAALSDAEKERLKEQHAELEKQLNRRLRKRFSRADFESLAIVGKGHFGQVSLALLCSFPVIIQGCVCVDRLCLATCTGLVDDCAIRAPGKL